MGRYEKEPFFDPGAGIRSRVMNRPVRVIVNKDLVLQPWRE